eukprot:g78659.t1
MHKQSVQKRHSAFPSFTHCSKKKHCPKSAVLACLRRPDYQRPPKKNARRMGQANCRPRSRESLLLTDKCTWSVEAKAEGRGNRASGSEPRRRAGLTKLLQDPFPRDPHPCDSLEAWLEELHKLLPQLSAEKVIEQYAANLCEQNIRSVVHLSHLCDEELLQLGFSRAHIATLSTNANRRRSDFVFPHAPMPAGGFVQTPWEVFSRSRHLFPKKPCLGFPSCNVLDDPAKHSGYVMVDSGYLWLTYEQVYSDCGYISAGLSLLGLQPGDLVGICSKNRLEWTETLLANLRSGYGTVALDDSLSTSTVWSLLQQAEARVVFVSQQQVAKLLTCQTQRTLQSLQNESEKRGDARDSPRDELKDGPDSPGTFPDRPAATAGVFLTHIIQWDVDDRQGNVAETVDPAQVRIAKELGIALLGLSELKALGQKSESKETVESDKTERDVLQPLNAEWFMDTDHNDSPKEVRGQDQDQRAEQEHVQKATDVACIMYHNTPSEVEANGAVFLNRNITAVLAAAYYVFDVEGGKETTVKSSDVYLSSHPLAFIFEVVMQFLMLGKGARVGFFKGDRSKLVSDMKKCRPTIFAAAPEIYSEFHAEALGQVKHSSMANQVRFKLLYGSQAALLRSASPGHRPRLLGNYADRTMFAGIRHKLGLDRCRLMLTGSSTMPDNVREFFRVAVSCGKLIHTYGLTDVLITAIDPRCDPGLVGHIGAPLPCCEVKLKDVPSRQCSTRTGTDNLYAKGEICVRGYNVFAEYFKNPEKTMEVFMDNGWLRTGYLARLNPNGTFSIIGKLVESTPDKQQGDMVNDSQLNHPPISQVSERHEYD